MTRQMLVAGNWKMNLGLTEATSLASALMTSARPSSGVDVAVLPPFPWLLPVKDALGDSGVRLGAQHCYFEEAGAFTGEVSPQMLAGVCHYVLAGHSERRHVFGEDNRLVGRKVAAILASGMICVLCAGETLAERQAGSAVDVVTRQLDGGLLAVSDEQIDALVIAYEPVWAIGTGVAATPNDAQEMCATVRDWMRRRFGEAGVGVQVLYGGSVTPENAAALFSQPDIDGALVGGASLKAESFGAIVDGARAAVSM